MASNKYGLPARQWWRHLKDYKREFWKRARKKWKREARDAG